MIELFTQKNNFEMQDSASMSVKHDYSLFIVADGAGGIGDGKHASQNAIDFVHSFLTGKEITLNNVKSCIKHVDHQLSLCDNYGETTLIVLIQTNNQIFGASVGDSSAIMVSKALVHDLTENQIRKPLVGSGEASPVGFGPLNVNGSIIIGTDGLFKYANFQKITEYMNDNRSASEIADLARLKSGAFSDDIAFILSKPQA